MKQMTTNIRLKKYPTYKHSGVDWLGEIPEHWGLLSNKYIFTLKKKLIGNRSSEYTLLSLTTQGVIIRNLNEGGKFPADFDTYQEVNENDFVFCFFDVEETPRCVGLSKYQGMITGAYTVLKSKSNFESKFLYYFYLNLDSDKRMSPLYTGLRNTISKDNFFAFKTFIPPLSEQTAIANFLDDKTAKIDKAIAKKEQLIALLKEQKQIIIQNAVTKGLNPKVSLKDSGVEWLGEIPEHWEVIRMKFLFKDVSIKNKQEEELLSVTQNKGVIPRTWVETRIVMPSGNLKSFKYIEKGDFAISLRSFEGGLEYCHHNGIISPAYTVLKKKEGLIEYYYKYLFKSFSFISEIQTSVVGIREGKNISYPELSYSLLPIPTTSEQTAIANFLDNKTAKINQAIAQQQEQIQKLKEYKATLIDSAVTGKINLTNYT